MSVRTTHRRPIGAGPADVGRRILVRHRDTHLSPALRAFLAEAGREMTIPDRWALPRSE